MALALAALLLSGLAALAAAQDANNTAAQRQLTNSVRLFSIANASGTISPAPYGQIKQVSVQQFRAFNLAQPPGVAELFFQFQPCSLMEPHTHPRGDEIVHGITGAPLRRTQVNVVNEAAAGHGVNTVEVGAMDVSFVPQGGLHYYVNNGCEPSSVLAVFNNGDPGTVMAVDSLLALPDDLLATAFGVRANIITNLRSSITAYPLIRPLSEPDCYKRCKLAVPT